MQNEKGNPKHVESASIGRNGNVLEEAHASGRYQIECYDANGNLKWRDEIKNLVTTAGKNDALEKYLAGSGYTAAWYLGLVSATGYTTGANVADTMASHGGWTEDQNYSQANRPTAAFASASAGSKALSSPLSFSITGATTIKGCFLVSNSTKGGTTGVLYSAGTFSGGDKPVDASDTLNVSYTASL